MKKLLLLALCALALPARAELVGLYTFDGANPLEAVIGSPAKEGVTSGNNQQPVLSDAISTISLVSDGTVLGTRTGVVAVPVRSTLAIPNPGLAKDWTIVLPFYCPASAPWRCFFKFDNVAGNDGSLFIKNDTDIGASSYTTGLPGIVGAWHQLTVSSANGTQTVWYDTTKLGQTRTWNVAGLSLLLFSFDNSEEDALMYLDDIRLYDETAPAEVFPDGTSGSPTIFGPYAESSFSDNFASFSRTPDQIVDDPPYRTYVFRRHGSFMFTPVKQRSGCSALFVGGGGAGGLQRGGGGGGGGVVAASDLSFLAQSYTATVGAGGSPAIHTYWYQNSSDANKLHEGITPATACGGDTTLAAGGSVLFTAHGGGGGGNFNYAGSNKPEESYGLAGASGGGSSGKSTVQAAGIAGEGHAGGAATTNGDNSAGGGGGAGAAGADGTQNNPGDGGAGVENDITGTAVVYGGGGGAGGGYNGGNVGAGGAGGGGTGVSSASARARTTAANGTDGLGGGGGGGSGQGNNPICSMGGRGGDGAIVLRVYMVDEDDPEPTVAVSASGIGYTNATFDVRLLSLGSGAGSADVVFRLSENADMSDPFFVTNLASAVSSVPAEFPVAWSPLLTNALYYAQATASNDLGVEGVSALFSFATLEPQPPTLSLVPAGVGFGSISATVSLGSFGAGSDSADLYLDCSFAGDFSDTVFSVPTHVASLPFSATLATAGLAPGSNYFYRVRAVNAWGVEGFTDVWQAETEADPVRLSSIGATPAGDGSQTISVSTLAVEPGTTYALTISVDGATVATFTGRTATDTFATSFSGSPGSSHVAVVAVSAQYGGRTYNQSARLSFTIGGNNVVVADWSAHCSSAEAIRVHVGDTIVLPALAWGWSYRILNDRFLSMDGLVVSAREPAVAGIEVYNGDTLMDTVAVLVLPEAIEGGDVYVYDEKAPESDRWNRAATWTKIGSATNGEFPSRPNDIAVIPFYDTTGTKYVRHDTDLSLGGVLFGQFRDASAECVIERHGSTGTHTVTFERADGEPAFAKVTPNTTSARTQTLRFGGYELLVECVSSVVADSCSNTTNVDLNRGKIVYNACTIHIPEGRYWAVDGLPGYDLNMGGTIGPPKLTGEGVFWKKGMGGITFDKQNDFRGTLLDTGHGHLGTYNRAASIFWNGGGGTNVSIAVAGWSPPRLGNPAEDSSSGYGRFRTGWEHFYGAEDAHPGVPWNPRKTMTLRGGSYIAYSTQNGPSWGGSGSKSLRLYEKLAVGPGMSFVDVRGNTSNKDGHPTNWVQWDDLEHEDKGTLVLFDWSRRSVAATQDSTNSVAMLPRHADFLVGAGEDGDCLVSDAYPIIPWIVAPTTTDDSSWRNTMFASFDAAGRLTRPIWNNTALDGVLSPFSNAYLWDKTIEIGRDVTANSLFMNNSGKNKWLGEGRTLTLTSGGLVLHGNNTAIGQPGRTDNGSLVLGDADHPGYVFAKASDATKPNQIWASVTAPGGFVSSYGGALVLGGDQKGIEDELVVNAGVLTLGTAELACSLVKNLDVRVSAGARLVVPRQEGLRGTFLKMDAAAGQTGTVQLDENSSCKKLYVRDWPVAPEWSTLPRGLYGSSESAAKNVRDDLFAGPGVLRVVSDDCIDPTILLLR